MTAEEESVQVDAYLNTLLAGRHARPRSLDATDQIDAELEATASLVQRALSRFHPSFAFEERLATQLRAVGAGAGSPAESFSSPVVLAAMLRNRDVAGAADERRTRTALLRNGAIASGVSIAGVSIAGAALLVRRRSRPPTANPAEAIL